MVFTSGVFEIAVSLVVEHLISREVHGRVKKLKFKIHNVSRDKIQQISLEKTYKIIIGDKLLKLTVNPDSNHPSPQNIRASISPMMYKSFHPSMLIQ